MAKHEREMPSVGRPKDAYQAQVRKMWGKYPLLTEVPSHKDLRVIEMAWLDASSATASDYKWYLQLPDKIISISADSLIT